MRCLLKITVALAVAVLANILIQPGGMGDELVFTARVYISQSVCGTKPDDPELVNAANRLIARQGRLPAVLLAPDGSPIVPEIVAYPDEVAAVGEDCSDQWRPHRAALACSQ